MRVETDELMSIGRFARLTGLSVKALRHYDELGLLRPAQVDTWTGYRWYAQEQRADAAAIRRLRELQLPLDEVGALLHADETAVREGLAAHRARLEGGLVETRRILAELDRPGPPGAFTPPTRTATPPRRGGGRGARGGGRTHSPARGPGGGGGGKPGVPPSSNRALRYGYRSVRARRARRSSSPRGSVPA